MSLKCPVEVRNGRNYTYIYREQLKRLGLKHVDKDIYRINFASSTKIKRIEKFCKNKGLKLHIINGIGERSTTYRNEFFKENPPYKNNKYYCAYCGRLIPKNLITVDHLYPVAKAKSDTKVQKKLKQIGASNVNDVKNLVPACHSCNARKGQKIDYWVFMGKIGRHQHWWKYRWIIRISIVLFTTITALYQCYILYNTHYDLINHIKTIILSKL